VTVEGPLQGRQQVPVGLVELDGQRQRPGTGGQRRDPRVVDGREGLRERDGSPGEGPVVALPHDLLALDDLPEDVVVAELAVTVQGVLVGRPLALLLDEVDGPAGARGIGEGTEFAFALDRPVPELAPRVAGEDRRAQLVDGVGQAVVEVADGDRLAGSQGSLDVDGRLGCLDLLEDVELGGVASPQAHRESLLHVAGEHARVGRDGARAGEARGTPDGVEEVGDQRHVQHLLRHHVDDELGRPGAAVLDRPEGVEVRRDGGQLQLEGLLEAVPDVVDVGEGGSQGAGRAHLRHGAPPPRS